MRGGKHKQDTFSHQSGLGVQSTQLAGEQSVPIGPRGLDGWRLCLLNHSNLEDGEAESWKWCSVAQEDKHRWALMDIKNYRHLVAMWNQASDVHKQAVRGDTARHEVVIRVTEDVELLCGCLCAEGRKKRRVTCDAEVSCSEPDRAALTSASSPKNRYL